MKLRVSAVLIPSTNGCLVAVMVDPELGAMVSWPMWFESAAGFPEWAKSEALSLEIIDK